MPYMVLENCAYFSIQMTSRLGLPLNICHYY